MARARNIKPGLFSNEVIAELPAFDRLLFICLLYTSPSPRD